jgi:hypothetical protein
VTPCAGEWSAIRCDGNDRGFALLSYGRKPMKTISVRRCLASIGTAVVLLAQISPALAGGQSDAQLAMTQGTRVPGMAVPGTDTARNKRHGAVDVTFTKWRTSGVPLPPAVATRSLFAGFVGGVLGEGEFVGEVLDRKVSTPCTFTAPPCTPGSTPPTITESTAGLQAIYEVQASEHFIALIQGGSNSSGGRLEGVIVSGWRTGAHVRVRFDTLSSCTDPDGGTHGPCFVGTISVERAPEE